MPQLRISTLGRYSIALGDQLATGFESAKVRALLVFLVVESNRPHSRESLAGLLWPDFPNSSAMGSLRNALANLRQAIGDRSANPPHLLITREVIQFNTASGYWLDFVELKTLLANCTDNQRSLILLLSIVYAMGYHCFMVVSWKVFSSQTANPLRNGSYSNESSLAAK